MCLSIGSWCWHAPSLVSHLNNLFSNLCLVVLSQQVFAIFRRILEAPRKPSRVFSGPQLDRYRRRVLKPKKTKCVDLKPFTRETITAKFNAVKTCRKNGLQLLRRWRTPYGAKTQLWRAAYSADSRWRRQIHPPLVASLHVQLDRVAQPWSLRPPLVARLVLKRRRPKKLRLCIRAKTSSRVLHHEQIRKANHVATQAGVASR